jgi:hypothetical protein
VGEGRAKSPQKSPKGQNKMNIFASNLNDVDIIIQFQKSAGYSAKP